MDRRAFIGAMAALPYGSGCAGPDRIGRPTATVADDVFRFKQTNSPITGEMTVASDQMSGGGSGHCGRFQLTLRRVNTFPSPAPKPGP